MERGEFEDLNLKYKRAFEAYKRAGEKATAAFKNGSLTTVELRAEEEAITALHTARREILAALQADVWEIAAALDESE